MALFFLSHELHISLWVATFDPRIGAVITQTHDPYHRKVGDIIHNSEIMDYINQEINKKVIAILGPPNSGKSVFVHSMLNSLRNYKNGSLIDNFYIIRACPDGEGNWFNEIESNIGKIFRIKKSFDDEFAITISEHINNTKESKSIIIVDCGGKIDKKNQIILNSCSDCIIISSNKEEIPEWIGAAKSSELNILSIIHSTLEEKSEIIPNKNVLEIVLGKLERSNQNSVQIPEKLIERIFNYE